MNNITSNKTFPEEDEYKGYEDCPPLEAPSPHAAKIAAYVIIIVVSFVGNILIISVTRRIRTMRQKVAFYFVVNLAIADLLTTMTNTAVSLAVEIRESDEWMPGYVGLVLCKLAPLCREVCALCSFLNLLAIALDRFFAICFHFPLKRIMTRRFSNIIILSTWLIPCILNVPVIAPSNVVKIGEQLYCVERWPAPFYIYKASRDYTIILFVFSYMLPLAIVSTLYSCVIYKIWWRRTPGNPSSTTNRLNSRRRSKALKMFIAIFVCFTLCWLPYHVTFFLGFSVEKFFCGLPKDLLFVSRFLAQATSALNPCIYLKFNKGYRNGVKRLLNVI